MDELLREMRKEQATAGPLPPAVAHFLKVSASYWPGLFHCYDVAGLPRTNNDLEQYFGSARYHQRRASGRVHAGRGHRGARARSASSRPPPLASSLRGVRAAAPQSGALAESARLPRASPGGAAPTSAVSQGPDGVFGPPGGRPAQAEFAVLEKKTRRASERDETKRAAWREQTRDLDPARFVWVDETGRDLGMTRPYSRAPRGQRAYGDVPGRRGQNRTLITALTVDGVGPGLLLDEAIDRVTFDGYIIHCLAPTLKARPDRGRRQPQGPRQRPRQGGD